MTDKQIQIVKQTWKIFRSIDPMLVGDVFYSRLFMMMPGLRPMFKPSMEDQYIKLVDMLNLVVARLDRLEEVTADIAELAQRHVQYGVRPGHYRVVGDALIWTLQKGLGKDWNEEVSDAWLSCYTILSDTMINASTDTATTVS